MIAVVGSLLNGSQRRLEIRALSPSQHVTLFDGFETNEPRRVGGLRFLCRTSLESPGITSEAMYRPRDRGVTARTAEEGYDALVAASILSARTLVSLRRDAGRYSALVKARGERNVLDALRLIDPALRGLAVVSEANEATVYADLGGKSLIPLAVCGEGMLRLFSIVLAITTVRGGVLLIDEIDNGLHHAVMADLWPVLRKLCAEYRVQLIATTHNDEMIQGALTVFRDEFDQLGLIRLDRTPGGLRAVNYSATALEGVAASGWEVRG